MTTSIIDNDERDMSALVPVNDELRIDDWHLSLGFKMVATGQPPPMEEWARIGQYIRFANTACQWWWGDWLNYGEMAYGEECAQELSETGWEPETLRNYAWVAARVPLENRHKLIRFSMYQMLAKLTTDQQAEWVQKIIADGLSRDDLRLALKGETLSEDKYYVQIACVDIDEQATLVERFNVEGLTAEPVTKKKKA